MNAHQKKVASYLNLLNQGLINQREFFVLSLDVLKSMTGEDHYFFNYAAEELERQCMSDMKEFHYMFSVESSGSIVMFFESPEEEE